LAKRLPFETLVAICEGREILRLVERAPYGSRRPKPDVVRFISLLTRASRITETVPLRWPDKGPWLVRVIEIDKRFIVGEYRRSMKTIGYLGGLDKTVGQPVTTRNWNTINAIARTLLGLRS